MDNFNPQFTTPEQSLRAGRPEFTRFQNVQVQFKGGHPQIPGSIDTPLLAIVEGYWDTLTGKSWGMSDGNPAAIVYGIRAGLNALPWDDDVLYVKIGAFGHLVHISEIVPQS